MNVAVPPDPEPVVSEGTGGIPMAKTYPAGTFEASGVPNVVVTEPEPTSPGIATVIPADPPVTVVEPVVEPGPVTVIEPGPVNVVEPGPAVVVTEPAPAPSPAPAAAPAPEPKAGADKASLESLLAGYQKKLTRNERKIDEAKGDADKMQSLHTRATLDLAAFTRKWYATNREAAGTMDAREAKDLSDRFLTLSERSETLLNQFNK